MPKDKDRERNNEGARKEPGRGEREDERQSSPREGERERAKRSNQGQRRSPSRGRRGSNGGDRSM